MIAAFTSIFIIVIIVLISIFVNIVESKPTPRQSATHHSAHLQHHSAPLQRQSTTPTLTTQIPKLDLSSIDIPESTNISPITDKIWISDYPTATNYPLLKKLGVKQILTIGAELPPHPTNEFRLMHIKLNDMPGENIKQHFNTAYDFIDTDNTLVHCAAGISRSASLVLSYLMRKHRITLDKALEYVKSKRAIRPNYGFIEQLKQHEKEYVL